CKKRVPPVGRRARRRSSSSELALSRGGLYHAQTPGAAAIGNADRAEPSRTADSPIGWHELGELRRRYTEAVRIPKCWRLSSSFATIQTKHRGRDRSNGMLLVFIPKTNELSTRW